MQDRWRWVFDAQDVTLTAFEPVCLLVAVHQPPSGHDVTGTALEQSYVLHSPHGCSDWNESLQIAPCWPSSRNAGLWATKCKLAASSQAATAANAAATSNQSSPSRVAVPHPSPAAHCPVNWNGAANGALTFAPVWFFTAVHYPIYM